MANPLLTLLIGVVAGSLDILPMIKMKLHKSAIRSAFVFYVIAPFVIFNMNIMNEIWVIKGGIITLALALPVMILAAKEKGGKKNVIPMAITSIILGSLIGMVGHWTGLM